MKKQVLAVCVILIALSSGCSSRVDREFKAGCRAGEVSDEICDCTYKKIKKKYSEKTLEKMSEYGYPPEGFMEFTLHATRQCVSEN